MISPQTRNFAHGLFAPLVSWSEENSKVWKKCKTDAHFRLLTSCEYTVTKHKSSFFVQSNIQNKVWRNSIAYCSKTAYECQQYAYCSSISCSSQWASKIENLYFWQISFYIQVTISSSDMKGCWYGSRMSRASFWVYISQIYPFYFKYLLKKVTK